MTSGLINRFTRSIFTTSLRRELTWALVIKMAALGLISWVFFADPAPRTAQAVSAHLLQNNGSDVPAGPMLPQGEPHGIGNRR